MSYSSINVDKFGRIIVPNLGFSLIYQADMVPHMCLIEHIRHISLIYETDMSYQLWFDISVMYEADM